MVEPPRRNRAQRPRRRLRRKALSHEMSLALGREVLALRPPQVSWKNLEERYGLCRARLVQLRRRALKAGHEP